jgi:hypothetical protein
MSEAGQWYSEDQPTKSRQQKMAMRSWRLNNHWCFVRSIPSAGETFDSIGPGAPSPPALVFRSCDREPVYYPLNGIRLVPDVAALWGPRTRFF